MPCTAGSTAFAVVAIGTLTYAHYYYARQIIVTVMVLLWALRLGGFLVLRVMATGGDSRFNEVKDKPCECPCKPKAHVQKSSSRRQQDKCRHSFPGACMAEHKLCSPAHCLLTSKPHRSPAHLCSSHHSVARRPAKLIAQRPDPCPVACSEVLCLLVSASRMGLGDHAACSNTQCHGQQSRCGATTFVCVVLDLLYISPLCTTLHLVRADHVDAHLLVPFQEATWPCPVHSAAWAVLYLKASCVFACRTVGL